MGEEAIDASAAIAQEAEEPALLAATALPLLEPVAAPAEAVVPAVAAATVAVAPFALPTDELAAIAQGAGLEWVGSDAEKIRAAQQAMAEAPRPARVPRERKPAAAVDQGPLVLVETRKDLSQVKLPFENEQRAP
jgi:ribonuclease E